MNDDEILHTIEVGRTGDDWEEMGPGHECYAQVLPHATYAFGATPKAALANLADILWPDGR